MSYLTFWGYPSAPTPQIFVHLKTFLVGTSQALSVHSPTPNTIARIKGGKKEGVPAIDGKLLEWVKADFFL